MKMMKKYTDVSGNEYTEEDIERWAAEAESREGYTGKHLGPPVPGRPISVGADARPVTLRLDADRRAKLSRIAAERHSTPSQVIRDLIDTL